MIYWGFNNFEYINNILHISIACTMGVSKLQTDNVIIYTRQTSLNFVEFVAAATATVYCSSQV